MATTTQIPQVSQMIVTLENNAMVSEIMHIPLTAPCCIHGVGPSVLVISADNQHWLWKHPRIRFETFHHSP